MSPYSIIAPNHGALSFRIYIYAYMYVCMYACISVTVHLRHLDCAIATDTRQCAEQLKPILFTRSRSIFAEHTEFSQYALRSSHFICLSALLHRRNARQDSVILDYSILFMWPRPLQPFPKVMGSPCTGKPSFWCRLQNTQLCRMQDKAAVFYTRLDNRGASVPTNNNGLLPHYQK